MYLTIDKDQKIVNSTCEVCAKCDHSRAYFYTTRHLLDINGEELCKYVD